jgi:hypothetical protein
MSYAPHVPICIAVAWACRGLSTYVDATLSHATSHAQMSRMDRGPQRGVAAGIESVPLLLGNN